jgi:hypothetical protein
MKTATRVLVLVLLFVAFSVLIVGPSRALNNCDKCCGPKPLGDATDWFACMHMCQDLTNQGNPPQCNDN